MFIHVLKWISSRNQHGHLYNLLGLDPSFTIIEESLILLGWPCSYTAGVAYLQLLQDFYTEKSNHFDWRKALSFSQNSFVLHQNDRKNEPYMLVPTILPRLADLMRKWQKTSIISSVIYILQLWLASITQQSSQAAWKYYALCSAFSFMWKENKICISTLFPRIISLLNMPHIMQIHNLMHKLGKHQTFDVGKSFLWHQAELLKTQSSPASVCTDALSR